MKDNQQALKAKLAGRLCTLTRESVDQPYGFSIHSSKNNQHKIVDVRDFSLASSSGLNSGDIVLEINHERIDKLNHADVVGKITTKPKKVEILVDAYSQNLSDDNTGKF